VLNRQYKYYEILGVQKTATIEEIKKAYIQQVKIFHPDINKTAEAAQKIKLLNEAYRILSNPEKKDKYDKAIAECPNCYAYDVIQVLGTNFRCKYCGCKFNASHPSDIIETIEIAAIPEKRKKTIKLFQSTQCSWCSKFYTNEPFLCPSGKLQSNCFYFKKLDINMRKKLMGEEKWWWRMADMLKTVEDKGTLCKCRMCGSLNPNPQKNNCWNCNKEGLNCPNCNSFLQYSTESNKWKCRNVACNKTYIWVPKKADNRFEAHEKKRRGETTGRTKINVKIYILRINNITRKFIKKIYHFSTSFFRWVSRVLKSFWYIFKRFIVLLSTLGITAIVLTAVSIFVKSSVIGLAALIVISIIGLILIVFGLVSISKYKLTFAKTFIYILLSVMFAVLSCAYLNIHSVNDIKDNLENLFISEEGLLQQNINEFIGKIGINLTDDTNTEIITVSTTVTNSLNSTITTEITTSLTSTTNKITKEYVYMGGGTVIGADGHKIILINNTEATNPTWAELISFLKEDNTDEIIYDYNSFVCADFAECLHNNAEAAGIKAGYVCVTLGPADYRSTIGGHALNIFETSDRGLVFIDCTGYTSDLPISADKLVDVEVGKDYLPQSIFASSGWYWLSMGEVISIDVIVW
jgi:hypothetical protein